MIIRPDFWWRMSACEVEKEPKFSVVVYMSTGQSGPSTEEKCRIRGTRAADGRVSIMTATFGEVVMFAVTPGALPFVGRGRTWEWECASLWTRFARVELEVARW